MVYRRSRTNIRKAPRRRRRQSVRRRASVRRRGPIRRRQMSKVAQSCPGELSPAAKFALAQLDPFEPKCLGAKVPDSNTMPSLANADTDQINMAPPSAGGNLIGLAFAPMYSQSILSATESTASAVAWSTNWGSRRNYNNLVAQVEAIRPVAHAIRLSSPLAPTSASGFVHIGLAVESRKNGVTGGGALPDLPKSVNEMTGLAYYKRFTLASLTQSPVTAINKWIDDTGFRYDDPRSLNSYAGESGGNTFNNTLNFGTSWGILVVLVDGQTSTAASPLSFEHVLLTECIPRKDAFILGSQAAPNSPGTMSAVSSMLTETDFSHTEAQQESYIQAGIDEIARGARVAGTQVYNNVAVPLLQRLGAHGVNTATNMAINAMMGYGGIAGVNANENRLALI